MRTNSVHVEVTQDDIKNGLRKDIRQCPIATALRRLPGMEESTVARDTVDFSDKSYWLPDEAQKFIDDFDNGETVAPFSFELTRRLIDKLRGVDS